MALDLLDPISPSAEEARLAQESGRALASLPDTTATVRVQLGKDDQPETRLDLPPVAVRLLAEVLVQLGEGNAVRVVGVGEEVTTGEGAELLNVSRPFFIKLLDEGRIPHRKVGNHRRARREDVLCYRREQEVRSNSALDALAAQAQRLGGYD